jgi:hypothetical protein
MGFFRKILDKLGIHKKDEAAPVVVPAKPVAAPVAVPAKPVAAPAVAQAKPAATPAVAQAKPVAAPVAAPVAVVAPVAAPKPVAVSEVDVVKHLEELAAGKKGLDWKVSIVDLLKLLELDSSFESRKELATELGCPAELMGDSAKMNVWLHKTVLKEIAANGGNIPANLLD